MRIKHRGAKTYTGLDFDVAKSALQKYIRRSDWDKVALIIADIERVSMVDDTDIAEQYVAEMNALPSHGKDFVVKNVQTRAKSMRTNMINRLFVIASEDISIANDNATEYVWKWVGGRRSVDIPLIDMIRAGVYLARSQKLRIISDYKTIHMLPPYYWKSPAQKVQCLKANEALKELFPFMRHTRNCSWITALEQGDVHNFFHALGQAMLEVDNPFTVLDQLADKLPRSALNTLYKKMTHVERPLYLYHAALRHMMRDDLTESHIPMDDIDPEYVESVKDRLEMGSIQIDDFCKDRHTGAGAGCTTEQFAVEGAYVADLDRTHYKWNYHVIYVLFKMLLDDIYVGRTPDIMVKLSEISHRFLEQVVPVKPDLSPVEHISTDIPQYQFLVDFYESKGIKMTLAQAERIFNGDKIPVKSRTKAKAVAKPKARAMQAINSKSKTNAQCIGDGHLKARVRARVRVQVQGRIPSVPAESDSEINPGSESAMFDPIARAQIATSAGKTDVYFAVLRHDFADWKAGERVVVKGPYRSGDTGCQYAIALNEWKAALGLPFIQHIACTQLIPDMWTDVNGLGVRYGMKAADRQRLQTFMISDDLLKNVDPLPRKEKSSLKWENTVVVDFDHPKIRANYWNMIKHWPKLSQEEQARLIAYHVIRYSVGIGDLADRNFLLIEGTVYALDEDAPKKGILNHPGKLLKTKRAALIRSWIERPDNWSMLYDILLRLSDVPPPSPLVFKKFSLDQGSIIELFQD